MSFQEKLKLTNRNSAALYRAAPKTMQAFQGLMRSATEDGALSKRIKELIALAIAVHAHCEGCIIFHVNAALAEGASREEISETLAVAIEMGGGPAAVYSGTALAAFEELKDNAK
jgi:AhpD family alkylhydroperoxidase